MNLTFKSTRIYSVTAKKVRRPLIEEKGYKDYELVSTRSRHTNLNELGYSLRITGMIFALLNNEALVPLFTPCLIIKYPIPGRRQLS